MNRFACCLLLLIGLATMDTAHSAAQRTFVASYGQSANAAFNCSLAKPCRSFSDALGVTSPGGEIIVLDSAGYGTATITQAVSIIAPAGVYAGISVFSGDGIVVNAAATDVVKLQGLALTGLGGANGIKVQSAFLLDVVDVHVTGFTARGIDFAANDAKLNIVGSVFADNGEAGVHAQANLSPVSIVRSRFDNNGANGVAFAGAITGAISDSIASNNRSVGFLIDDGSHATLSGCKVSDTYDIIGDYGVLVRGPNASTTIERCDVFGAYFGFRAESGARAQINDSTAQVGGYGFIAFGNGTWMTVERSTATNSYTGFAADAGPLESAMLRMSNSTATANSHLGVGVGTHGVVYTRQNNTVEGNATDVQGTLTPYSPQ